MLDPSNPHQNIAFTTVGATFTLPPHPVMSLQPTTIIGPTPSINLGKTVAVTLHVDSVANLWSWKAKISWDPAVLNLTSGPTEGSFMGSGTLFLAQPTNYTGGFIKEVSDTYLSTTGQSGSGDLAVMTFKIIGFSAGSPITISEAVMLDPSNPHQNIAFTTVGATFTLPPPAVQPTGGVVGITGYKLVFTETMHNTLGSPELINYHWSFSIDKWNGAQWVATGISGSSAPVTGYFISALATVDLPYYVYLLPLSGSNAVAWGDWLRISYTLYWTSSSTNYSTDHVAKLHVHPADIAGRANIAPYYGADGSVGPADLGLISPNWKKTVPPGTDPTSNSAKADINGDGSVGPADLGVLSARWKQTWTNTPPP
jgi:hypothetical protein